MQVEVLIYDGFDELDAVGPYEVFRTAKAFGGDVDARVVTLTDRAAVTASHGLRVEPDGVAGAGGDGRPADTLLVPGGGWADPTVPGAGMEAERGDVPGAIRDHHDDGGRVAGVCTGGMLLARAGVLDGRPAVTHASALDDLRETGADVVDARVVDDGDVLTAGGVTSGLDLALYLVGRESGERLADRVATELEYDRSDRVFRRE